MPRIMKKITLLAFIGMAVLGLASCKKGIFNTSNQNIINMDGIKEVYFTDNKTLVLQKVKSENIKSIIDILNSAEFDNDRNDGKMYKMVECSIMFEIRYTDDTVLIAQLWDDLLYVNQKWYKLDINKVKENLY